MAEPFRLEVPDQLQGGSYANLASVWHTAHEFTLDFGATMPPESAPNGEVTVPVKVVARVKMPVSVIFDLLKAINANMTIYEETYGPISGPRREPEQPDE